MTQTLDKVKTHEEAYCALRSAGETSDIQTKKRHKRVKKNVWSFVEALLVSRCVECVMRCGNQPDAR